MKRRADSHWDPRHRASIRHRVAVEAARMLYHREVKEYLHAKREAARRQGTSHLPSNWEVHEQLLLIARKIDADDHRRRLSEMRAHAVRLMETLEAYHPRLIGSVLTGHIRKGSDIDLHVYSEEVDDMCAALEAAGYAPTVEVVRTRKYGEPRDFVHVRLADVGGYECEITVYRLDEQYVTPRCGITGGAMRRASLPELRRLLAAEEKSYVVRADEPVLSSPLTMEDATRLVPELLACRGVAQNHYHHLDVLEHTWSVVTGLERMIADGFERFGAQAENLRRHVQNPSFLLLAGICHDLGKPATQTFARDGRIRFLGHEQVGADMVRACGGRLGLSASSVEALARVVECHIEAVRIPSEDGEPSRIRRLLARAGDRLPELALLSMSDVEAARGPAQSESRIDEHAQFVDFLLEQYFEDGFLVHPTLPLTGDDLTEVFGVLDARTTARLLESLTDAFVDGEFEGREEALALASELLERPQWDRR